jgi:hypothetical protein
MLLESTTSAVPLTGDALRHCQDIRGWMEASPDLPDDQEIAPGTRVAGERHHGAIVIKAILPARQSLCGRWGTDIVVETTCHDNWKMESILPLCRWTTHGTLVTPKGEHFLPLDEENLPLAGFWDIAKEEKVLFHRRWKDRQTSVKASCPKFVLDTELDLYLHEDLTDNLEETPEGARAKIRAMAEDFVFTNPVEKEEVLRLSNEALTHQSLLCQRYLSRWNTKESEILEKIEDPQREKAEHVELLKTLVEMRETLPERFPHQTGCHDVPVWEMFWEHKHAMSKVLLHEENGISATLDEDGQILIRGTEPHHPHLHLSLEKYLETQKEMHNPPPPKAVKKPKAKPSPELPGIPAGRDSLHEEEKSDLPTVMVIESPDGFPCCLISSGCQAGTWGAISPTGFHSVIAANEPDPEKFLLKRNEEFKKELAKELSSKKSQSSRLSYLQERTLQALGGKQKALAFLDHVLEVTYPREIPNKSEKLNTEGQILWDIQCCLNLKAAAQTWKKLQNLPTDPLEKVKAACHISEENSSHNRGKAQALTWLCERTLRKRLRGFEHNGIRPVTRPMGSWHTEKVLEGFFHRASQGILAGKPESTQAILAFLEPEASKVSDPKDHPVGHDDDDEDFEDNQKPPSAVQMDLF